MKRIILLLFIFLATSGISQAIPPIPGIPANCSSTSCTPAIPIGTTEVDGHANATLTPAQVTGTTIHNVGQAAADISLTLPTATKDGRFVLMVGTAQAANKWRIRAAVTDKIYLDGTAGSDNGYVKIQGPAVGNWLSCKSMKTDAYDWICITGDGVWTAE